MKSKILVAALGLLSINAFAHIEVGTWTGVTPTGEPCSFVAGERYFDKQTPHPLNERIPVTINGETFIVGHPSVIDVATSTASFNHDLFHGVLATPTGAHALVVDMAHTEEYEGPTQFNLIQHAWKANARSKVTCTQLKHVKN